MINAHCKKWLASLVYSFAVSCLLPITGFVGNNTGLLTATAAEPVTFAAIGDYGDGSVAEANVANQINGWNVDFIIGAGDNRYGSISYDTAIGQFYCSYMTDVVTGAYCGGAGSASNAFFPVPGNHDYTDGGGISEFNGYFNLPGAGVVTTGTSGNERYYDFVQGPVHFFGTDSQAARGSSAEMTAQKNWLQQQLAASTSAWQVVFIHHAPYSSANHGSYPELQWPYAAWGADAVIAGHDHVFERLTADGIPYFVNGLGGRSIYSFNSPLSNSEFRYNAAYGAMRITASDAEITFEFINTSGTIIDSYSVSNSTPVNAPPIADFAYSTADLEAYFTDTSSDSDGSIASWSWDFGDGTSSSITNPNHIYTAGGDYVVALTVTDDDGAMTSVSRSVAVSVSTPQPPNAPTDLTKTVEQTGKGKKAVITKVTLDWSDNSSDETGFVVEQCFETTTGKGRNRVTICDYDPYATANANVTNLEVPTEKGYRYRVKAVNNIGSSGYSNEVLI